MKLNFLKSLNTRLQRHSKFNFSFKAGSLSLGLCGLLAFSLSACQDRLQNPMTTTERESLYAQKGHEIKVQFTALYQTSYRSLEEFEYNHSSVSQWDVRRTLRFLFGPLVNRDVGGPQKGELVSLHPEQASLKNGFVVVPYDYEGHWLVSKEFVQQPQRLPLPYQSSMRTSPAWKKCGDYNPEHQTEGFFWYFWDPTRYGCDHVEDIHYQMVDLIFSDTTPQTVESFPEYQRMIRNVDGKKVLEMTFAFGYVEDAAVPNPFFDTDFGMSEFRKFLKIADAILKLEGQTQSPILLSEYNGHSQTRIGTRYTGSKNGVNVKISVVAAAGVDQMILFAKSYAENQESAFAWFGHSRVGSGFDADNFQNIVYSNPSKYRISNDYQLIYWAGCNSYSYYTIPFFEMKSKLNPTLDPAGTKNLDIISNGLPSFFALNAQNAGVLLKSLVNWQSPTSYQSIVNALENGSQNAMSALVLVNVLGDEDNQ